MKKIKIKFSDFWYDFDPKNNFWTQILDEIKIPYELVSEEADLLISSVFGNNHLQINDCRKKMIWIGENIRASNYYNHFDKIYSFDYEQNQKNYRLPLYLIDMWERDIDIFLKCRSKSKEELKEDYNRRNFCIFVCSNPNYPFRNIYFHRMNKISIVHSYGRLFNNMGFDLPRDRESKVKKSAEYRFSICFENGTSDGYVTEKINDGFRAGGIPIYYGSPRISEEFNEKSFINVNSIGVEKSLELVENIQNDFELYYEYYSQPIISSEQKTFEDRFREFNEDFLSFLETLK